jgi:hypothetical protein
MLLSGFLNNLGEYVGAASQFIFNVTVYEQMDDTYSRFMN